MAYTFTNSKGVTYVLHARERVSKTGKVSKLHFFAKEEKEGAVDAVPPGYTVSEMKTGLPVLKKTG